MQEVQAISRSSSRIVMRGSLEDFALTSVLQNASLTRQLTRVDVAEASSEPVGSILLKSGQIIAAVAGEFSAVAALRKLMRAHKSCYFTISKLTQALGPIEPLGPIEIVLRKAVLPADDGVDERKPVMRGQLDQVGLRELCASLSISRRLLEIEALSDSGEVVARLAVKSGFVVAAETRHAAGRVALRELHELDASSFVVYHSDVSNEIEPLCSMADLFVRSEAPPPIRLSERPAPPRREEAPRRNSGTVLTRRAGTPVITVLSPKGGAGKTTIALNLSVALAERGMKVVLLDLDEQSGVLAALDALGKHPHGIYDVAANKVELEGALLPTSISSLRLLPPGDLAGDALELPSERLNRVLDQLRDQADVVIIDTPAGLRGITRTAASCSSHVLGVAQAEPLSARAFRLLPNLLQELGPKGPILLGVVVNMLDYRNPASVATLDAICKDAGAEWVFDVPFARTRAFLEASELGVPLGLASKSSAPSAAWLFQGLATSVLERLSLLTPKVDALRLL